LVSSSLNLRGGAHADGEQPDRTAADVEGDAEQRADPAGRAASPFASRTTGPRAGAALAHERSAERGQYLLVACLDATRRPDLASSRSAATSGSTAAATRRAARAAVVGVEVDERGVADRLQLAQRHGRALGLGARVLELADVVRSSISVIADAASRARTRCPRRSTCGPRVDGAERAEHGAVARREREAA